MKSLAKDTALYGLSSILGRLLNWLLVPLYIVAVNDTEFGEITNLYAWTALLVVFLTYGLETGFFRFAGGSSGNDPNTVYSTCMSSLWTSTALYLAIVIFAYQPIASALGFAAHPEYILMMGVVIAIDVISSLPFGLLRFQKRPLRFASIKLLFVFFNITFNIFFLVICPKIWDSQQEWLHYVYDPSKSGVFYILLANLLSSASMSLALWPQLFGIRFSFDKELLKRILRYSFPLMILGVAGIINQTADKILFPMLVEDATAKSQLGIYGANFKFAVVMIMFIQAFRFAYEPFVFAGDRSLNNTSAYVKAMKYFIIFGLFIFLSVGLLIPFLPHIPLVAKKIDPAYFTGLAVVPIVMLAEFFFGIFFNLSFWYKLTDKTKWGAYFSVGGCVLTVLLNVMFVPLYGYMACAWTAFTVYLLMMLASYFVGKRHFPIPYELKNGAFYFCFALILYTIGMLAPVASPLVLFIFRIILIIGYIAVVISRDLPLSGLFSKR